MPHARTHRLGSPASSSGDDGGDAFPASPHPSGSFFAGAHCRSSAAPSVYRIGQLLPDLCHGIRGMVFCIVHHIPPFHYVIMEGRHIHHLVFGILILLFVGYGWLCEVGNGSDSSSILASSLMSMLYGLGAALTLDEFALWLNLKDVYFVREGRSSFDAIILFGSLLAISTSGAPLFSASAKNKRGD
jgi:hypothetical protein